MKPARAMPKRSASKNATAMNMRIATIAMASAFSHPQSKKCLTSASQIISTMIEAIMPEKKYVITPPIRLPKTAIHMASVNFAFSLPAKSLPLSQSAGATKIIVRITCIRSWSKLSAIFLHSFIVYCS